MASAKKSSASSATREKLLQAAIGLIRQHGFSATTVDRICAEAKVTKGAFFHHFASKDDLGNAAVAAWCREGSAMYADFLGSADDDPLVRLGRLLDGMIGMADGSDEPPVCLLGMMAQELAETHDGIRETCSGGLGDWTATVTRLLAEARKTHVPANDFDPDEVGWMLNSLWQGSMLIAKTRQDPTVIVNSLRHARTYIFSLFSVQPDHATQ